MSRGFILIEASVAYVVLALALAALVPVYLLCVAANKRTEFIAVSTQLSSELLEEVRLRKWDKNTPNPPAAIPGPGALGLDAGENAADKRSFDDVDDFNGWSEAPPRDPLNAVLPRFAGYSRAVAVSYVDAALNPVAGPTDFKQVRVCTTAPGMKPLCLDTMLANR